MLSTLASRDRHSQVVGISWGRFFFAPSVSVDRIGKSSKPVMTF